MSLFDSLKDLGTKLFDVGEFSVDNLVFRLHRIATVVLLLTFSVVASLSQVMSEDMIHNESVIHLFYFSKTTYNLLSLIVSNISMQYVGDPIECIKRDTTIDSKLIDTYCWIHGTYTQHAPSTTDGIREARNHLDFAVCDPFVEKDGKVVYDDKKCWHHAYYQFVTMVLVCQAAMFYFPW